VKRVLTGIKPTGVPHLGNVLGAILPAVELAQRSDHESFLFIADLHSLTVRPDPEALRAQTRAVAASWLACGLDPERVVFYRQSDVPEIPKLSWILSCSMPLGLLNRAHSFKDALAKGATADEVNVGLYAYPVLMAADILAFDADLVPVGKDQKQHLEITQEAARRFNLRYGEVFKVPDAVVDADVMTIPGLDGRKMSKSYDNTLVVFDDEKTMWKRIKSVATDSTPYGEPLSTEDDVLFQLTCAIQPDRRPSLARQYTTGRKNPELSGPERDESANYFGWGDAKKALLQAAVERFAEARERYRHWTTHPDELEDCLRHGAEKARHFARAVLDRVEASLGLSWI
jgi:tryptophanyl-tRNA synthetase